MKLHRITAHNFMSLHSFEMNDLDPHVNFVVGPNGAGKTTIFRALRVLRDAFAAVRQANPFNGVSTGRDQLLNDLRRRATQGLNGATPTEVDIAVEVTLDTPREADLLAAFLGAALSNREMLQRVPSQEQVNKNLSDPGVAVLSSWLLDVFRNSDLTWLRHGTLRMRCWLSTYDPRLIVGYTCQCGDTPITFSAGWRPIYSPGHLMIGHLEPNALPAHEAGEPFIRHLKEDPERWSQVLDALTNLEPTAITSRLDVQTLVRGLASNGETLVAQGAYQYPYPPAHRLLSELTAVRLRDSHNDRVSVATVFSQVIREGLVFTENVRTPLMPSQTYTLQQIAAPPPEIGRESDLSIQLLWLKNGDPAARRTYQCIQHTFEELVGTGRHFDVIAERLNAQPAPQMPRQTLATLSEVGQAVDTEYVQPDSSDQAAEVALNIMYIDRQREIPLADQGTGIWELLVLSTLIHDSTGRVILLDEPAANLHPTVQHTFRDLLHRGSGQFVVVTHSQHMLPTRGNDIGKVRRLTHTPQGTRAYGVSTKTALHVDKIEKELSMSSDVAGLLFANGVILVEGATETLAIAEWFPRLPASNGQSLSDINVALHSVNGKDNFPLYIQFLHEFGVPWAVICDADAIDLRERHDLWRKLKALRRIEKVPKAPQSFEKLKDLAARGGAFTANSSLDERNFEGIPSVKQFMEKHKASLPEGKPLRGRYVAQRMGCPPEAREVIEAALKWIAHVPNAITKSSIQGSHA